MLLCLFPATALPESTSQTQQVSLTATITIAPRTATLTFARSKFQKFFRWFWGVGALYYTNLQKWGDKDCQDPSHPLYKRGFFPVVETTQFTGDDHGMFGEAHCQTSGLLAEVCSRNLGWVFVVYVEMRTSGKRNQNRLDRSNRCISHSYLVLGLQIKQQQNQIKT